MKLRKGLGIGMGMGYKNLMPMDSHIHSLSAKGQKTIQLRRVPYGKKSTPKKDREYQNTMFRHSPVGSIKEWKDYAKKSGFKKLDVLDFDENFEVTVKAKGELKKVQSYCYKCGKKMGKHISRNVICESCSLDAKGKRYKKCPKCGSTNLAYPIDKGDFLPYCDDCGIIFNQKKAKKEWKEQGDGWLDFDAKGKEYNVNLKLAQEIQKEEDKVPQTYEDEGFVEDESTYLDSFFYKGYDVALYRNSGQNNVYYSFQINKDGENVGSQIDSGNLKNDIKKVMKDIDDDNIGLNAKSTTSLVVKPVKNVTYHKGLWQNVFDAKHPKTVKNSQKQDLIKESTMLKKKIKNLLYDANTYKKEKAQDHELLTITVLKDKLPHFNFLTSHTDTNATGYFKDKILDIKFDKENNVVMDIEYLDTKNEKIGKELIKSFNRLNDIEIGESFLYVRSQPLEETSLPLEEWR